MWDLARSLGTPASGVDPVGSQYGPSEDPPYQPLALVAPPPGAVEEEMGDIEDAPVSGDALALLQQRTRSAFDDPEGPSMEEDEL